MLRFLCLVWPLAVLSGSPARAHFNMLLPEKASAKRGESLAFVYQWGHPFEHQLFDAPAADKVFVIAPGGKKTELTHLLEPVKKPAGDKRIVTAYRFRFTPEERGDFVFTLSSPPIWMEEDEEFLQDSVKVVLHVQAQKGWDSGAGNGFEMMPLTRPYGLLPGMVFQARALVEGKPVAGTLVEIERYNHLPPAQLPPDEYMTRTAKTDPNGVVTCTLPESGWWCVAAQRQGGKREHKGKMYPVRERAIFWLFVDDKMVRAPAAK